MGIRQKSFRSRQNAGMVIGLLLGTSFIGFTIWSTSGTKLTAPGKMNTGHDNLKCEDCHRSDDGTLRQKLQANAQYTLNNRDTAVTIGYKPVQSKQCLECHQRPNDPHAVYRFLEPRFIKVRKLLKPHSCISCHREHLGTRVSINNVEFCKHCHDKDNLDIKKDSLDTSHKLLAQNKRWDTCIGCHDYHSNHIMDVPSKLDNRIDKRLVNSYFKGETISPYSTRKRHQAKKELAK